MIKNLSFSAKIAILFSIFVLGIIFTAVLSQGLSFIPISQSTILLSTMALQNILAFALPAFILALMVNKATPLAELTLNIKPTIKGILAFIIIFIVATPALNAIVQWNESISLPESMSQLQTSLRELENAAAQIIDNLLKDISIFGLLGAVLVIGLLTGFGEELFFRGGLQRILTNRPTNPHVAIWVAAIVFSLLHFQFFGFVPRVLLGAFFGYLYLWSGTIWLPIIAHAMNNSTVLITKYLVIHGYASDSLEEIGTTPDSMPIIIASILLTATAIYLSKRYLFATTIKKD